MTEPVIVYDHGTYEFQPVAVKLNGVEETSGVAFEVVSATGEPTGTFDDRDELEGDIGVWVKPDMASGRYRVWCKVNNGSTPERPVFKVYGMIQVNG